MKRSALWLYWAMPAASSRGKPLGQWGRACTIGAQGLARCVQQELLLRCRPLTLAHTRMAPCLHAQRVAPREEVERLASEEMVEEYCVKHRRELEDLVKYNIAVRVVGRLVGRLAVWVGGPGWIGCA